MLASRISTTHLFDNHPYMVCNGNNNNNRSCMANHMGQVPPLFTLVDNTSLHLTVEPTAGVAGVDLPLTPRPRTCV
jgi:hypothetical protein